MSDLSGRPQYDDRQSEEDEAVADSGTDLANRRLAASSGEPTAQYGVFRHRGIHVRAANIVRATGRACTRQA